MLLLMAENASNEQQVAQSKSYPMCCGHMNKSNTKQVKMSNSTWIYPMPLTMSLKLDTRVIRLELIVADLATKNRIIRRMTSTSRPETLLRFTVKLEAASGVMGLLLDDEPRQVVVDFNSRVGGTDSFRA